jgi:hypothetical protein
MRIFQPDFSNHTLNGHRLIGVEHRSKRMMRACRPCGTEQDDARHQNTQTVAFHTHLSWGGV